MRKVRVHFIQSLYLNRSNYPTEDEQFLEYKKVLEGMKGKRVVIRSLDIGGDKAADPTLTEKFIQMGVDELSVAPSMILKIKEIASNL